MMQFKYNFFLSDGIMYHCKIDLTKLNIIIFLAVIKFVTHFLLPDPQKARLSQGEELKPSQKKTLWGTQIKAVKILGWFQMQGIGAALFLPTNKAYEKHLI